MFTDTVSSRRRSTATWSARSVYSDVIAQVPHKRFTFSPLWALYAYFEVRQGDVGRARRALG